MSQLGAQGGSGSRRENSRCDAASVAFWLRAWFAGIQYSVSQRHASTGLSLLPIRHVKARVQIDSGHHAGRIRAGRHSGIVRELSAVLGWRLRHDRIPLSALEIVRAI
jgi:hypothetical protein